MAAPPVPATILRIAIDPEDRWLEALPAAPPGVTLTVSAPSLTAARHLERHASALRARGYRYVGHHPVAVTTVATLLDVVVPGELATTAPAWWRDLLDRATHVHSLAFGPVAHLFGGLARRHRASGRTT